MTISTRFHLFSPISTGSRSEEALNVTWVELQSVGKPYPTPVSLLTLSSLHSLKLHSHIPYTPQTRYTHSVPWVQFVQAKPAVFIAPLAQN